MTFARNIASSRGCASVIPRFRFLAFTATATARVRTDIIAQLALRDPKVHVASFNRPNLFYRVLPKTKKTYREVLALAKGGRRGHRLLPVAPACR